MVAAAVGTCHVPKRRRVAALAVSEGSLRAKYERVDSTRWLHVTTCLLVEPVQLELRVLLHLRRGTWRNAVWRRQQLKGRWERGWGWEE